MENVAVREAHAWRHEDSWVPDKECRDKIESESSSDMRMCWTCGSCDFECPVNITTGCLRPQRLVRFGNLGLMDDLLFSKELWYCVDCRRCGGACPNQVKPWALIGFARQAAVVQKRVSRKTARRFKTLWAHFQRVRWQIVKRCLEGREINHMSQKTWDQWLSTEVPWRSAVIRPGFGAPRPESMHTPAVSCQTGCCFTCGECGSVCPISSERGVFDIRAIIRMVNLKMVEELLRSPSIWLCLSCECCSTYCSQGVDGEKLIRMLQALALSSGRVDHELPGRIERSFGVAHQRLIHEIDGLLDSDGC